MARMTVTAPPRPPRSSDSLDHDELEVLVEALIEEARQRTRRRRRKYGAMALLVALAGIATFAVYKHTSASAAQSRGAFRANAAGSGLPAGTIALTGGTGTGKTFFWTSRGLRDPGIKGRAVGWSPDGTRLLVERWGVGPPRLYVVRGDGSSEVRLPRPGDGYNAAWSPDGTRIAFEGSARNPAAEFSRIYVVGADGHGLRRLPGLATVMGFGGWTTGNLAWSPDGTHILFAGRTKKDSRLWLYLVPADGSARPRPFPIRGHVVAPFQPVW